MAAADKFAFSRFSEQRSYKSSDTAGYDEYVEGVEAEETVSLHTPIGQDNIGFRLITKMGWNGTGLGRNEQGRRDPVPFEMKDDNMGLGRWQMELEQAQDATEKRKQLEIEKEITPDLIEKYKAHVEKEQRIADATADLRRTYYCEPCDKQYRTYSELDNHLNSYDHHHKQRLKELYQQELSRKFGGQKNVVEEKEKKLAAKQVAVERERMLARRAKVGANPGFKPIGHESATTSDSDGKSGGVVSTGEEELPEKRAKVTKYGMMFQSAGVLNSVSERVTPKATPKATPRVQPQKCIDMFAEPDVTMTTEQVIAPSEGDDVSDEEGDGNSDVTAPDKWAELDSIPTRPSFSKQPHQFSVKMQSAPHFLSTLSRPTPAPTKPQPPLPVPSVAHQAAGPPPLLRKGHHVTQSFKTDGSDDEDEGLIRARLPVTKEHKIKFSINK